MGHIKLLMFLIFLCLFCLNNITNANEIDSFADKSPQRKDDTSENVIDETLNRWNKLQRYSSMKLRTAIAAESEVSQKAWLQLALISKKYSLDTNKLIAALKSWRSNNPDHPANQLFPADTTLSTFDKQKPLHFAVLLPLTGQYKSSAKSIIDGFLSEFYVMHEASQTIKFYDTNKKDIFSIYRKAIADGADFIIGPLTKQAVQQVSQIQNDVPILALNYTDARNTLKNFYEFGLSPEDEAMQMAYKASEANLSKALIIAPENEWGNRVSHSFMRNWKAVGGLVIAQWHYGIRANFNLEVAHLLGVNLQKDKKLMRKDNKKETLRQQRRQDFDVIFLFASAQDAKLIVPLLRFYYADDVAIYAASTVLSDKEDVEKNKDLSGIIVCDIPKKIRQQALQHRIYAVGQDAYLLSQTLYRLNTLPHFPLYANTGALSLTENQQIRRRVPCLALTND